MKRYLKYALLIMVVLLSLVMGGCQAHYSIYIEYEYASIYMEDKMIDILIPERKYNSAFMELNSHNGLVPEESEIVRYKDENGYSSMFFHTNLIQEYSFSQEKAILTLNSKNTFYNMCNDYGTFRLAVFDKNGKIQYISEEIPFKSSDNYYLSDVIKFNPMTKEINQSYRNENGDSPVKIAFLMFAWVMPFVSAMLLLVFFLPKDVAASNSPYTLILFGIPIIPLAIYLLLRYDEAIKASVSEKMALEIFFDFGSAWILAPYVLVPYIVFAAAAYLIYRRRKNDEESQSSIFPEIEMK